MRHYEPCNAFVQCDWRTNQWTCNLIKRLIHFLHAGCSARWLAIQSHPIGASRNILRIKEVYIKNKRKEANSSSGSNSKRFKPLLAIRTPLATGANLKCRCSCSAESNPNPLDSFSVAATHSTLPYFLPFDFI